MSKFKEYICTKCGYTCEMFLQDSEKVPPELEKTCPECDSSLVLGPNLKDNSQRWRHND